MDSPTVTLIGILRDRVESLRANGDLDEALHAANAAVEKTQHTLSAEYESIDNFASCLELRAGIHRELGQYELARDDYRQAIDQLDGRLDRLDQIGRLRAGLGSVYDSLGNTQRAIEVWEKALDCFERHEPPLMLDIAAISNNLGALTKASGDLNAAENYYLRALEIMHSELGKNHEETADVSNNLGALYLAAGFTEQAREMHMIALETRRELFGETHPDTAQSHNNLALALLQTGDRAWAKRHFEKSLTSFEALGIQYGEDLEAVSANYCEFLRADGESGLAEVIDQRVQAKLGRV
jgi:tetratricopeptide (TPR) repeat protein